MDEEKNINKRDEIAILREIDEKLENLGDIASCLSYVENSVNDLDYFLKDIANAIRGR